MSEVKEYNVHVHQDTAVIRLPGSNMLVARGEELEELARFAQEHNINADFWPNEGLRHGPDVRIAVSELDQLSKLLEYNLGQPSAFIDNDKEVLAASPKAEKAGFEVGPAEKKEEIEQKSTQATTEVTNTTNTKHYENKSEIIGEIVREAAGEDKILTKSELETALGENIEKIREALGRGDIKVSAGVNNYEPKHNEHDSVIIGPKGSRLSSVVNLSDIGVTFDPNSLPESKYTSYVDPEPPVATPNVGNGNSSIER